MSTKVTIKMIEKFKELEKQMDDLEIDTNYENGEVWVTGKLFFTLAKQENAEIIIDPQDPEDIMFITASGICIFTHFNNAMEALAYNNIKLKVI